MIALNWVSRLHRRHWKVGAKIVYVTMGNKWQITCTHTIHHTCRSIRRKIRTQDLLVVMREHCRIKYSVIGFYYAFDCWLVFVHVQHLIRRCLTDKPMKMIENERERYTLYGVEAMISHFHRSIHTVWEQVDIVALIMWENQSIRRVSKRTTQTT